MVNGNGFGVHCSGVKGAVFQEVYSENTRLEGYAEASTCDRNTIYSLTTIGVREDMGASFSGNNALVHNFTAIRPFRDGIGCSGDYNVFVRPVVIEGGYQNNEPMGGITGAGGVRFYGWTDANGLHAPHGNRLIDGVVRDSSGHAVTFGSSATNNYVSLSYEAGNGGLLFDNSAGNTNRLVS